MSSNLDRFNADIERLTKNGKALRLSMRLECFPDETREQLTRQFKDKAQAYIDALPFFRDEYQKWYSESLALVRQVLPDRLADFTRHYEKPKTRKELSNESYRIEDYLQGLESFRGPNKEKVVGRDAAISQLDQQIAIVAAARQRFDSSLFDIRHLVQADLFDSELEAAEHLAKSKFGRAAGALAGVVLERHLGQVCVDHKVAVTKKKPTISDFNDALKSASVIEVPQWRYIQHLADIRNICDHASASDPTKEQIADLIAGVKRTIKTVF